jgi:hypothetical protein
MKVIGIHGEPLPGIPTPRLAQAGGGKAYFVPNTSELSRDRLPGVWYLYQPEQGYAPTDGSEVRFVRVVDATT